MIKRNLITLPYFNIEINCRSLVLQSCNWLTDDILKPVLKNNPKLEVLDIADCVNCTSAILQALNFFLSHSRTGFSLGRFWLSTVPTSPGSSWEAVPGLTLMASITFQIIETAGRKQMISKYVSNNGFWKVYNLVPHKWLFKGRHYIAVAT